MLLLAALLLAPTDVLDVDPTSGPFFEIRHAVAAASSGDVIRYSTGTYEHFGVFEKSLTIVPRAAGDVATIAGTVRVQNLLAGQRVVLADLEIESLTFEPSLIVAGNDGSVRIEGGRVIGGLGLGVQILNSSDVTFEGSQLFGGCLGSTFGCQGSSALNAEDSNLTLWDAHVSGRSHTTWGYVGVPAIRALRSDLFIHGGSVRGGNGGDEKSSTFSGCESDAGDGGDGILAVDTLVRRRDASISVGSQGWSTFCFPPPFTAVDVRLLGGSTLVEFGGDALTLTLDARWYTEGATASVRAEGTPGETVLLVLGPETGRVNLPAFVGDLHVGGALGGARRTLLGSSPAQVDLQLPDLAPFGVLQWTVQSVHLRAGGEVVFGPTRAFTALDAAW